MPFSVKIFSTLHNSLYLFRPLLLLLLFLYSFINFLAVHSLYFSQIISCNQLNKGVNGACVQLLHRMLIGIMLK